MDYWEVLLYDTNELLYANSAEEVYEYINEFAEDIKILEISRPDNIFNTPVHFPQEYAFRHIVLSKKRQTASIYINNKKELKYISRQWNIKYETLIIGDTDPYMKNLKYPKNILECASTIIDKYDTCHIDPDMKDKYCVWLLNGIGISDDDLISKLSEWEIESVCIVNDDDCDERIVYKNKKVTIYFYYYCDLFDLSNDWPVPIRSLFIENTNTYVIQNADKMLELAEEITISSDRLLETKYAYKTAYSGVKFYDIWFDHDISRSTYYYRRDMPCVNGALNLKINFWDNMNHVIFEHLENQNFKNITMLHYGKYQNLTNLTCDTLIIEPRYTPRCIAKIFKYVNTSKIIFSIYDVEKLKNEFLGTSVLEYECTCYDNSIRIPWLDDIVAANNNRRFYKTKSSAKMHI